MNHNVEEKTFTIDSTDAESEVFEITVAAKVEFPTDYTKTATETLVESFTFELTVDSGVDCATEGEIENFVLAEMRTSVFGGAVEQFLPTITEKTGECGKIAVEIVQSEIHAAYLSFDKDTGLLTLKPED